MAFADAFIVIALHVGNLAIVSVLVALYPVLTVILAATILKERMTKLQSSLILTCSRLPSLTSKMRGIHSTSLCYLNSFSVLFSLN